MSEIAFDGDAIYAELLQVEEKKLARMALVIKEKVKEISQMMVQKDACEAELCFSSYHGFSRKAIVKLLAECGLRVVKMGYEGDMKCIFRVRRDGLSCSEDKYARLQTVLTWSDDEV